MDWKWLVIFAGAFYIWKNRTHKGDQVSTGGWNEPTGMGGV